MTGEVLLFHVLQHILFVKQYILELSFGIHFCLVFEMFGPRVSAFTTGQQGFCFDFFSKFNGTNKTVSAISIAFFAAFGGPGIEGRKAAPGRRGKGGRYAGLVVINLRFHGIADALKTVDLAPGNFPTAMISLQLFQGLDQKTADVAAALAQVAPGADRWRLAAGGCGAGGVFAAVAFELFEIRRWRSYRGDHHGGAP